MKKFNISISTPTGKSFEITEAVIINVNLLEGQMGVMAKHTPLVSSLKISKFSIKLENSEKLLGVVHGGIFNVTKEEVSILTTRFDWSNEININKTQDEISNIKNQMQSDIKKAEADSLNNRLNYENLKLEISE